MIELTEYRDDESQHTIYVNPDEIALIEVFKYHSYRPAIARLTLRCGKVFGVWQTVDEVNKRMIRHGLESPGEIGITVAQYHAGLNLLWAELPNRNVMTDETVFERAAKRLRECLTFEQAAAAHLWRIGELEKERDEMQEHLNSYSPRADGKCPICGRFRGGP